jgi:hypothetical protein
MSLSAFFGGAKDYLGANAEQIFDDERIFQPIFDQSGFSDVSRQTFNMCHSERSANQSLSRPYLYRANCFRTY